jgi:hypothetical protein
MAKGSRTDPTATERVRVVSGTACRHQFTTPRRYYGRYGTSSCSNATGISQGVVNWQLPATPLTTRTRSVAFDLDQPRCQYSHPFSHSKKERPPVETGGLSMRCRRRPTLPRPLGRSTIGAVGLNDRVRNGNGCGPYALVASENRLSKIESWGGRIRTCNFRINSPAVCQLTYTPVGTGRGQHTMFDFGM